MIKDDPYELRFAFPRGTNFLIKSAAAHTASSNLPVKISNHQGWAVAQIASPRTAEVKWEVHFIPADFYAYPTAEPAQLWAQRTGLDGVNLHWREQYYLNIGYQVYLNGALVGYTPDTTFALRGLDLESNYVVQVKTVWEDGKESPRRGELKFSIASLLPAQLSLLQVEPLRSTARWRGIEADERLTSTPFQLGERRFESGLGAFPNSEIEYDLKALYSGFLVLVGVDASSRSDNGFEFLILGDGKVLWRSGALKKSDEPKPANVAINGVRKLVLRVTGSAGRGNRAQADWVEPRLTRQAGLAQKEAP
jgi:hypothetical protein